MGLIKAAGGALAGTLGDQWREYFYCDAQPVTVLVSKGVKRSDPNRSSNSKGTDNIITNGATIAVNNGQAIAIVDQGKVIEFCAEPGEFVWDTSSQPSVFCGGLGEKGLMASFAQFGRRFTFGGDAGSDQRIYFFNLKEIIGNKYGTTTPLPFRIVDKNTGLDLDAGVRCNGEYSFELVDPIKFYTNVSGNVESDYQVASLESQMRSELLTALQPVFGKLSEMGIRYSAVPAHTEEICDLLNEELSEKWFDLRGLKIVSFGCNSITLNKEDEEMIKEMQRSAALGKNPDMARGYMTGATGEAMKSAGANENGAMAGFMGMGMAGMAGGANLNNMFNGSNPPEGQSQNNYPVSDNGGFGGGSIKNQQQPQQQQQEPQQQQSNQQVESWVCSCGTSNTGKFCQECGKGKPVPQTITCPKCGKIVPAGTKFCDECGTKLVN